MAADSVFDELEPDNQGSDTTGAMPDSPPPSGPTKGCEFCGSTRRHKKDCPNAGQGSRSSAAPKKNDADLQREVAAAWLDTQIVIKMIAKFFNYEEIPPSLTNDEAEKDAKTLATVVRDHPSLIKFLSQIAAPIIIARRVAEKFKKRKKVAKPDDAQSLRA